MYTKRWKQVLAGVLPLMVIAAACGGGDDDEATAATTTVAAAPTTTAAPATTAAPVTTAAPATTAAPEKTDPPETTEARHDQRVPGRPAGGHPDRVAGHVPRPEVGFSDGSGRGSGFIISPDGLAVTNNHVVTGAATLEVFVGGDTEDSYNATVLGVSECNDLALIDINESEPLPYLEWFDGDIAAGTDVYAAGFPLGDPEFTLTRGIVAKAEAGGDLTGTSSIDHTLEHDAAIQPGNSGGPLVTTDGTVARHQLRRRQRAIGAQYYAIASDLAQPVIERADGRRLRVARHQRLGRLRRGARRLRASGSPVSPPAPRRQRPRSCPVTS